MKLVKRIKASSDSEFLPVKLKLFHRTDKEDYLLGIEGKVVEQTRVKLGMKPLTWGHLHAGIVFPDDLKELMSMLEKN